MYKKDFLLSVLIFGCICISLPACGGKNQSPIPIQERQYENKTLIEARQLLDDRNADDAISLLKDYCQENPQDFPSEVLLAEAYFEKCSQLKENGDKQYQTLIQKPFKMGKVMIVRYRDEDYEKLAEGLYVCAKSYLINNYSSKAIRYINKAIKLTSSPRIDYLFVQSDAYAKIAFNQLSRKNNRYSRSIDLPSEYDMAKRLYRQIIANTTNDRTKGLAYYRLGLLLTEGFERRKGRKAFESALIHTEDDFLRNKIREVLDKQ